VSGKGLHGLSGTDVPKLGECIASTRDEYVLVRRVDADGHDVAEVVSELGDLRSRLDIPQHAGHVSRGRNYSAVVDEATAGQVARVPREFSCHTGRALTGGQVVNGADVVETTAGNVVPAGSVRTSHHPR